MSKLERKDIKIFGDDDVNNQIVQFGSTRNENITPSKDPDILQALPNYGLGWKEGVIASSGVPPFEEFNALQFLISRELAYIQQVGIPEYSLTTTYFANKSIVRTPEGTTIYKSAIDDNINYDIESADYNATTEYFIGDAVTDPATGDIYFSLTDNNIGNALNDVVNWQLAWVFLGDLVDLKTAIAASQAEVDAGIVSDKYVAPSTLLGLFNLSSNAISGYARIPINISGAFDEIIIQWGTANATLAGTTVNFPLTFPNGVLSIHATARENVINTNSHEIFVTTESASSFVLDHSRTTISCFWFAIGY